MTPRCCAIAEQHGVRILEVEYLTGWGTAADRDEAQQTKERTVFHMARAFGVRHLNAGLLEKLPLDVVGEEFAALCERAGPDLTVALEFMPYSGVPDLATAWQIVQGVPNAGLIVDGWHWARAGQQVADLDDVPAERIVSVQLCDVRARADGAATRGVARPSAAAREGLRRHGRSGAGLDQTRRHARRHGGRGDLRRASGPRRRRRRAGIGGRGPRGPRIRRDLPDVAQLKSP